MRTADRPRKTFLAGLLRAPPCCAARAHRMDPAIFEEVAEGYDAGMAKGYLAREIVPSHKFHFGKTHHAQSRDINSRALRTAHYMSR